MTEQANMDIVTAAADLGRRDTTRELPYYAIDEDRALVVTRLRDDEHVAITDLESHLPSPLQPRGTAQLHDPAGFAAYVHRLGHAEQTTVWADVDNGTVTAVLDDHRDARTAGWREHRVVLALQPDSDWQAWMTLNGKLVEQERFAEFLEQQMHSIGSPPAADLYEVATTLQANRQVTYQSGVRLKTGDVRLTFDESTDARAGGKGELEIPDEFTVRLAPFAHTDRVELMAKLRFRISRGELHIGYQLIQPHEVRRDAFASLVGKLHEDLTLQDDGGEPIYRFPVLLGTAPRTLRHT